MRTLPNPWRLATLTLFGLMLVLVFTTFGNYGMSWDQQYRLSEGAKKLQYYQNLFSGHYAPYDSTEDLYPGFYDLLLQIVNLASPFGLIYTDHLLTGLAGVLTMLAAYRIGRMLGGRRAGFFSALFLALFPHFYGHMFINPKDIPFACGYLWSLYYILKTLFKPLNTSLFLKLSLAIGITLAIRLGGFFLIFYLGLVSLLLRIAITRQQGHIVKRLGQAISFGLGIIALSFVILLPAWPFAHPDPIGTILHTLTKVAHFPWNGPVVFNGTVYAATNLPWYYLPQMLLVTTPEFLTALLLIGLIILIASKIMGIYKEGSAYFTANRSAKFFLVFCFLFPIAVVSIRQATLYDGIRHFLFILGPWAILAALTFDKIHQYFQKHATHSQTPLVRSAPFALKGMIALCAGGLIIEMALLHPYQYIYYNRTVGGIEKAWRKFDTEYWGTSHKEAVELLAQTLAKEGDKKVYKVTSSTTPWTLTPMAPWLVENFLPENLQYTYDIREADFYISFLRFDAHRFSDGKIMESCVVSRKGVPIAIVKDRRSVTQSKVRHNRKSSPALPIVSGILDFVPTF